MMVVVTSQLEIPSTQNLGTYLKVSLIHGHVESHQYRYLVDIVGRRLNGWRVWLLSKAARFILIQSATTIIPTYVMYTCHLPQKTIDALEKCNRDFFWGDWNGHKSIHAIAWQQVCCPKVMGGLGTQDLKEMNHVLLAKLVCRGLQSREAAWPRMLQQKYSITRTGQ